MPYLAFARKYRPKDFDEIIEQAHVVTTLKHAIVQNNLAHAYLFSGPRGTGKTSTARILAKALNCKNGPTDKPCNKCISCKEISEARSLDVLEIDGASNRGIDEIRTLRENVKFAPTSGRFKIYIIDEVHMLTAEAFNALLKTLEEPPAHVKFVFATTQPHKVLPTILSRCQRFDFRPIGTTSIMTKLKKLAHTEKIQLDEDALFAIAKSADGSLRDAEVVFDQLNSFSQGKITLKDVNSVLGLMSWEVVYEITNNLSSKNITQNLAAIGQLIQEGKDPAQLLTALIEHFRNMMLIKCNCEKIVELPKEDKEKTRKQSENFSLQTILYFIAVLSNTQERTKRQGMGRLFLEMALIKISETENLLPVPELMEKIEHLKNELQKITTSPGYNNSSNYIDASSPRLSDKEKEDTTKLLTEEAKEGYPKTETEPQIAAQGAEAVLEKHLSAVPTLSDAQISIGQLCKLWPKLIEVVKKKKMSLGLCLSEGQPISMDNNVVEIGFLKECEFHRENLEHNPNLKLIEQILSDIFGKTIKIKLVSCEKLPKAEQFPEEQAENLTQISQEPEAEDDMNSFIQSVVDVFNGRIVQTED